MPGTQQLSPSEPHNAPRGNSAKRSHAASSHFSPERDSPSPASWRLAILLPGGIAMLLGLNAGLLLLGVSAPLDFGSAAANHGIIMTLGFIGALISLERAVPNGTWWAYAAPVLLALGAITGVIPVLLEPAPRLLILLGTLLALAMYWPLWRRNQDPSVAVQALGAALAVGAAMQWVAGSSASAITPWLAGFLILTIAGERMELSRLMIHMQGVRARDAEALGVCVLLALAAALAAWRVPGGFIVFGIALIILAVRFALRDVARYTVRASGLPRFSAACMLIGYTWLALAGGLWIAHSLTDRFWDACVHAIMLGFVMAMILAHASIILPAVLRRPLLYTRWFWLVLALLESSLAIRVAGDIANVGLVYRAGGVLTVVSVLAFVVTAVSSTVVAGARQAKARAQVQPPTLTKAKGQNPPEPVTEKSQGTISVTGARRHLSKIVAFAGALTLISAAVLAGHTLAENPSALNLTTSTTEPGASTSSVAPTGNTTTLEVSASAMMFTPNMLSVPAGDHVILNVTNDDSDGQVHDLVISTENGQVATPRLSPGMSAKLDLGVVTRDLEGWCSVAGHRSLGMSLTITAVGGSSARASGHTHTAEVAGTDPQAASSHEHSIAAGQASAWKSTPFPEDFAAREATAPKAGASSESTQRTNTDGASTHRLTMTVDEIQAEVAPGVMQEVWTFNGTAPGPVLRAKVGDTFEITFINNGTLGHGIDFHSSALAPDGPMRTIQPGERLTYNFTAQAAGVFTYHCSAHPMSLHIAQGMAGLVIIDPAQGLPAVDHEFVLAQSEQYHGEQGGIASEEKIAAKTPDAVVFNGYPNQYVADPLEVKVGGRVRLWVSPIGPNEDLDFHVVGGQFDTVWKEGAYELRCGEAPWSKGAPQGSESCVELGQGRSQTVHFGVTQGGFVELSFHEAGHYTFINHQMVNAENGARGIITVKP